MLSTSKAGTIIFVVSCAFFAYYSFWVLITPFIDKGHSLLRLFPPLHYAILIPTVAGAHARPREGRCLGSSPCLSSRRRC